jgi:TPR repeat protein
MRFAISKKVFARAALGLLVCVALYAGKVQWDSSREAGYVAFNAGRFDEARKSLWLLAELGDGPSQQLMGYMSGLGLGGPIDFADSFRWMRRGAASGVDARQAVSEQAYYLGRAAVDGLYGADKKEIGRTWLRIAELSGSKEAEQLLAK